MVLQAWAGDRALTKNGPRKWAAEVVEHVLASGSFSQLARVTGHSPCIESGVTGGLPGERRRCDGGTMSQPTERIIATQCCVVGGGPAGMMLALLLARAGIRVAVLEKHGDFLRDFRGDTVHPSTLAVLDEIGIKQRFDALPQQRVEQIKVQFADGLHPIVDFRGLTPFPYLALVPQWDFLDFLADEATRFPGFDLHMQSQVTTLLREGRRVIGVRAQTRQGSLVVKADVVVGCDGRSSDVRAQAGLRSHDLGAPMDVLWFRLPRSASDRTESFGVAGRGRFMVLIQREQYWQIGYVIPKGSAPLLRQKPIEHFRTDVARRVKFLADRTDTLESWSDVKLLEVQVDCLLRWFGPGLLMIGDAAHAMSPIGGVGINLAIQDAVAAANALIPPLRQQRVPNLAELARVQLRRILPTQLVQGLQVQIQQRLIAPALRGEDDGQGVELPALLRRLLMVPSVRRIPARVFGVGFGREHVAALAG
jgi:2-polyprenyl-6-methoxyphenol hydroxylase-like FAD-dependent oxidoreductase